MWRSIVISTAAISSLLIFVWCLLISILYVIEEIVLDIRIDGAATGIFRILSSSFLFILWLALWYKLTLILFRRLLRAGGR